MARFEEEKGPVVRATLVEHDTGSSSSSSSSSMAAPEAVATVSVVAPPGRLGVIFEDGGRVACLRDHSPLLALGVAVGSYLSSVDGFDVSGLSGSEVALLLVSRDEAERRLHFRAAAHGEDDEEAEEVEVGVAVAGLAGVAFAEDDSRPPRIVSIGAGSPLLGRVAVGARLVEVDGEDVSDATWDRAARDIVDAAVRKRRHGRDDDHHDDDHHHHHHQSAVFGVRFRTPVLRGVDLRFVQFCPTKRTRHHPMIQGGCAAASFETFDDVVQRANRFIATSHLHVLNVETILCDATPAAMAKGRFRKVAKGGTTILRVWYDARDPKNQSPHVRFHVNKLHRETADDIAQSTTSQCLLS